MKKYQIRRKSSEKVGKFRKSGKVPKNGKFRKTGKSSDNREKSGQIWKPDLEITYNTKIFNNQKENFKKYQKSEHFEKKRLMKKKNKKKKEKKLILERRFAS